MDETTKLAKVLIKVFDPTTNDDDVVVDLYHVVIQPQTKIIRAKELLSYRNNGTKVCSIIQN